MGLSSAHSVVEICAGAGGQSLGLHQAGFSHSLAIELDPVAASTLRRNLDVPVAVGDVASRSVWDPREHAGVTLLAGGVPCPPFSAAGRQLGSSDERDLFAWAIEQVAIVRPRVLLLENVRGLSSPRFSAYRQRVLDRLDAEGYVGEWKLVYAADHGVPQLRPRFILVAMSADDHRHFHWPSPLPGERKSVGESLYSLMRAKGWAYADEWRYLASDVGPTLVGGSKKHGGADLGPTRAKLAWSKLYVDGRGIADDAPPADAPSPLEVMPRLTVEMCARIQGWLPDDNWVFEGRKTAQYRQVGNAFPPPVAKAIGQAIIAALERSAPPRRAVDGHPNVVDPIYRALAVSERALTQAELLHLLPGRSKALLERRLAAIERDFDLEVIGTAPEGDLSYRIGDFKGFTGQDDHARHEYLATQRGRVS